MSSVEKLSEKQIKRILHVIELILFQHSFSELETVGISESDLSHFSPELFGSIDTTDYEWRTVNGVREALQWLALNKYIENYKSPKYSIYSFHRLGVDIKRIAKLRDELSLKQGTDPNAIFYYLEILNENELTLCGEILLRRLRAEEGSDKFIRTLFLNTNKKTTFDELTSTQVSQKIDQLKLGGLFRRIFFKSNGKEVWFRDKVTVREIEVEKLPIIPDLHSYFNTANK